MSCIQTGTRHFTRTMRSLLRQGHSQNLVGMAVRWRGGESWPLSVLMCSRKLRVCVSHLVVESGIRCLIRDIWLLICVDSSHFLSDGLLCLFLSQLDSLRVAVIEFARSRKLVITFSALSFLSLCRSSAPLSIFLVLLLKFDVGSANPLTVLAIG